MSFKKTLHYITNTDDSFDPEYDPTLKIYPGPPYNEKQKIIIHQLLSKIFVYFNSPLLFGHFELFGEVIDPDLDFDTEKELIHIFFLSASLFENANE